MREIFLGEVIRQRRQELGLTQEEVCEGICEPMTISRFENGRQTPSRNRVRALLQRLGLPDDRFYGLLSAKELEISRLEKEIVSCNVRFERAEGEEKKAARAEALSKLQALEQVIDGDDTLSQQLILRSRYLLGTEQGRYNFETGMDLLLEAMRLTKPRFDLRQIEKGLYTEQEVKLLNNMALCYSRAGKHVEALDILRQLLRYLQTEWEKIPPHRAHIPLVAYNYARELVLVKRFQEAIEIAEYGREMSVKYGNYLQLPGFLAFLAESYYNQGKLDESIELYRQSYYLYKAICDDANCRIVQEDAKHFLNLDLN